MVLSLLGFVLFRAGDLSRACHECGEENNEKIINIISITVTVIADLALFIHLAVYDVGTLKFEVHDVGTFEVSMSLS